MLTSPVIYNEWSAIMIARVSPSRPSLHDFLLENKNMSTENTQFPISIASYMFLSVFYVCFHILVTFTSTCSTVVTQKIKLSAPDL